MKSPPARIHILGHPVVMLPVMGMGSLILYQWSQNADLALLGIVAIAAMAFVAKASERRMEYARWRRAWNAMADDAPAPSRRPLLGKVAVAVIVPVGFVAYESEALSQVGNPVPMLVAIVGLAGIGAMIVRARRWFTGRRARPSSRSDVVSICARSPMRVPSLEDAYRALPAHCWRVLDPASD